MNRQKSKYVLPSQHHKAEQYDNIIWLIHSGAKLKHLTTVVNYKVKRILKSENAFYHSVLNLLPSSLLPKSITAMHKL
jgi:hypothetical protein